MLRHPAILIALAALQRNGEPVPRLGTLRSPDGTAVATSEVGEAGVAYLSVRRGGRRLLRVTDAQGFALLEGQPATRVFASSGLYGKGTLSAWSPSTGESSLIQVRKPTETAFVLERVRHAGRRYRIAYSVGNAEGRVSRYRRKTLDVSASSLKRRGKARKG